MRVTVAVCTFNRARLLDNTLDAFMRLKIPSDVSWEVLVVNNNSTDDTEAVVRNYVGRLPIRSVFEGVPGKSRAANRAVQEASGELVLWTDDDVLVDEQWLTEYVAAARRFPEASFFGGTVDPWFESAAPNWVLQNIDLLSEPYALTQHGTNIVALDQQAVVGANMALRLDALRRFPFDASLGPTGSRALRGEETDLLARMREAGLSGMWVGSARVRHFVASERMQSSYLWHWYGGLGTYVAHREGAKPDVARVFGAPRWAISKYAGLLAKYCLLTPTRSSAWLRALREAALMRGYISEARRLTATPSLPAKS